MLSDCCCYRIVGIVAVLLMVQSSYEKPTSTNSSESDTNNNRTKPRILFHPPKDFHDREQEIIFPDSISDRIDQINISSRFSGQVPQCAGELTYCETLDLYPYSHIKTILDSNKILKSFFGQDEAPAITNRLGHEDETYVCSSYTKIVFPQLGETKNSKWKLIVNMGDDSEYKQGIQVEVCRNQDSTCDIPGVLPDGYSVSCRQKYLYRKLVSLDNKGEPATDSFKMPSGCACAYKHSEYSVSRFGKVDSSIFQNKTV